MPGMEQTDTAGLGCALPSAPRLLGSDLSCITPTPSLLFFFLPALISRVLLLFNIKTQTKPHVLKQHITHRLEASCERGCLLAHWLKTLLPDRLQTDERSAM